MSEAQQPQDGRHEGSLPRYLWLAPSDEDFTVIYNAWIEGRDPRKLWCENGGGDSE